MSRLRGCRLSDTGDARLMQVLIHDAGQFLYIETDGLEHGVSHSRPSRHGSGDREPLVVLVAGEWSQPRNRFIVMKP